MDAREHLVPFCQVDLRRVNAKLPADDGGKIALFQHDRRLIEHGKRQIFDHTVRLDVAEHGNLFEDRFLQRLVAAQDDDVGIDAHALKLLDGMLRGLGFMFFRAAQIGDKGHMDKEAVLPADLQRDLANGLQKRLGLDVADGAADLRDNDVRVGLFADGVDEFLDLVRDVRNDLHRRAEIFAAPLLVEDVPVDLTGRQIGILVQILVDEALIVAEVKVGFRTVLSHIDLAMLIRAHGAGIDVDIRVKLLRGDLETARLQKPSERRGSDALAKPGYDAACDKNVLYLFHKFSPPKKETLSTEAVKTPPDAERLNAGMKFVAVLYVFSYRSHSFSSQNGKGCLGGRKLPFQSIP